MALTGALLCAILAPPGAAEATTTFQVVGWAGASLVKNQNGTVISALTAASSIKGTPPRKATNSADAVHIGDVFASGASQTSTAAFRVPGGVEVLSHAVTTDLSMLGGAIKAQTVYTTSAVIVSNGVVTSDSTTTFVGLKIGGKVLPATVPKNFVVTVPNIATVVLNATFAFTAPNAVSRQGDGMDIALLEARGMYTAGAHLEVNPAFASVDASNPSTSPTVGGAAYGTALYAGVGQLTNVHASPTAPIAMPSLGTGGVTREVTIAGADLNPVLQIGAVTDSATGTRTATVLDSRLTSQIAGITLFGGAIRADSITVTAHAHGSLVSGETNPVDPSVDGSAAVANLVIGGKRIPLNVSPNTVLTVANLGTFTINQQVATSFGILVRALDIRLSTARGGLPVGAEIQVGTAIASES